MGYGNYYYIIIIVLNQFDSISLLGRESNLQTSYFYLQKPNVWWQTVEDDL